MKIYFVLSKLLDYYAVFLLNEKQNDKLVKWSTMCSFFVNLLLSSVKHKDFKMNSFSLIKRQALQYHKSIPRLCIIFNILSRSSKHFLHCTKNQHFDLRYYSNQRKIHIEHLPIFKCGVML